MCRELTEQLETIYLCTFTGGACVFVIGNRPEFCLECKCTNTNKQAPSHIEYLTFLNVYAICTDVRKIDELIYALVWRS